MVKGIFRNSFTINKKYKILILGNSGVGKTSLKNRYIKGNFRENELMTIGLELSTTEIQFNGTTMKMEIYDLVGQNSFNQPLEKLIGNIHAGILVFDLTRHDSFFAIRTWLDKIYDNNNKFLGPIIIVGNKLDITSQREIPSTEVVKLIHSIKDDKKVKTKTIEFIESSAKTGENVDKIFRSIAVILHNHF